MEKQGFTENIEFHESLGLSAVERKIKASAKELGRLMNEACELHKVFLLKRDAKILGLPKHD